MCTESCAYEISWDCVGLREITFVTVPAAAGTPAQPVQPPWL
jgi:hypothetical protein